MPRQVFTAGEILTAANMNDLADATVMVFADSAARGSAIPTPSEGMITYLSDTDAVEKYDGSAFVAVSQPGILQVVSVTKDDVFTTASTSYTDVTGLSVSITPTSASSKIMVFARLALNITVASTAARGQMLRGSTAIGGGTAAGARPSASFYAMDAGTGVGITAGSLPQSYFHLDSPATTTATTYKIQVAAESGTTATVNRGPGNDLDNAAYPRLASTITVMEVAG